MTKTDEKTQKRTAAFEKLREEMREKGFSETVRTISVLRANVAGVLAVLPIIAVCILLYVTKWGLSATFFTHPLSALLVLALLFVSVAVHEFLHGVTWACVCEHKWQSVSFGVMWSQLTPYCTCAEPLSLAKYCVALLMPFAVLGVGMFALALAWGNAILFELSLFNILAACGDILIGLMLTKHRNAVIIDHPTAIGFLAFSTCDR